MNPEVKNPSLAATRRLIRQMTLLMAVVGLTLVGVVVFSARAMDANTIERNRELIDNSINARATRALSELRSVAWWDEAVVKSRTNEFDRQWLDLEVGVFVTESYHHDRVMILDEEDRPIYGFADSGPIADDRLRSDTNAVIALVEQVRGGGGASPRITDRNFTSQTFEDSAFSNRRYGRSAAAVIKIGGHGELASVMAITPSVDMALNSDRPRLIVSFIKLDDQFWKSTGRDTLMPDLGFQQANDSRKGTMALKTDAGEPLGTIRWSPKRPGRMLIENILPMVLLGLAGCAAIIGALGRRLMTAGESLAAREAAAQHLANHDALTGLPNRRKLETELLRHAIDHVDASARLAVACIDLDRFKDINDTLGHHAGDQLIKCVGERLRAAIRPDDFMARLGGDEFAILRICDGSKDADQLLAAVHTCFDEPFPVSGHLVESACSVGIAFASADRSFDQMLREADIALYEAKARGRACGVRFEAAMGAKIERRRSLEIDLRKAIANRELSILYQPIVEAATGQIASVEALVRWTSARHGSIGPDVFIPIAEDAGLMADIGRFVIDRAIADAARWPTIETAINISPAQLRSATILTDLIAPTEKYGVAPERITIEITESLLMGSDARTIRTLNVLKQRGFTLSLDDFGTGYSSLAYLRDFPFDKLKIDRSFVKNLDASERALQIVEAVANFGRILGREIIAEGIETEQEMQAMQRVGCTHLQGFLFSKPQPAAHIEVLAASLGRLSASRDTTNVAARPILRRV